MMDVENDRNWRHNAGPSEKQNETKRPKHDSDEGHEKTNDTDNEKNDVRPTVPKIKFKKSCLLLLDDAFIPPSTTSSSSSLPSEGGVKEKSVEFHDKKNLLSALEIAKRLCVELSHHLDINLVIVHQGQVNVGGTDFISKCLKTIKNNVDAFIGRSTSSFFPKANLFFFFWFFFGFLSRARDCTKLTFSVCPSVGQSVGWSVGSGFFFFGQRPQRRPITYAFHIRKKLEKKV